MAQDVVIVTVHGTRAAKFAPLEISWRQRIAKLFSRLFRRVGVDDASTSANGITDTRSGAADSGWWKPTSRFSEKLLQRLRAVGINPRIQSFEWSGANSGSEREGAAIALKRKLKKLTGEGSSVYLIGHSHGGNVVEDALERFGWRLVLWRWLRWKGRSPHILGVTSVGTPFFLRRRPRTRWLAALLFFLLWLFLAAVTVVFAILFVTFAFSAPELLKEMPRGPPAAMAVAMFLLYLVLRSNAQFMLPRFRAEPSPGWLSIWHPHDEAISALQAAENLGLEFYAPGAIARKIRLLFDSAIVYVLSAMLATVVLGAAIDKPGAERSLAETIWLGWWWVLLLIVLMRLTAKTVDRLLRGQANSRVRRMLRSVAFGQDHYIRLSNVATKPWVYGGAEFEIRDELATRMRNSAEDALIEFVRENQAAVFLVGAASTGGKAPTDLMEKLTWRELVHTTYFDYDEIADEIAQHIVKMAQAAALAREPLASAHFNTMPAPQSSA